ncbi:MAG: hypothetical protein F6K51_36685, partial [Moorea sp. SIO3I8]|nr:hypothetical protein [Moorena sp. SIO3I8]
EGRRQKAEAIQRGLRHPYSLLPTPYSLLPTPYSLLPTPFAISLVMLVLW